MKNIVTVTASAAALTCFGPAIQASTAIVTIASGLVTGLTVSSDLSCHAGIAAGPDASTFRFRRSCLTAVAANGSHDVSRAGQ